MNVFLLILCIGLAAALVGVIWVNRKQPFVPVEKPVSKVEAMDAPPPPLDPVVAAIIQSLDHEEGRWDVHPGMAFRDDGLSVAPRRDSVSIQENYVRSRHQDPIVVPGEHNGLAVEQAIRLFLERKKDPNVPTYDDVRRKLGI